jgi:hypothetical protein
MTQQTVLYAHLMVEVCASSRNVILWSFQKLFNLTCMFESVQILCRKVLISCTMSTV